MTMQETIVQYKEDFDLFPDANDKLEYIFDLGKKHTTLAEEEKKAIVSQKNAANFKKWLKGLD